jgi:hypothetical protein
MSKMQLNLVKAQARARLACVAMLAAGAAAAGPLSTDVTVKVKLVSSSGACGAVASEPAVSIACQRPKGPLLPEAGAVPYQRVGTISARGVVAEPLLVYSDGTKITSWRVVTLDNAHYVELTIAW